MLLTDPAVRSSTQLWRARGRVHWFASEGLSRIKTNVGLRCLGRPYFDEAGIGAPLCAEVPPCQAEPPPGLQHPRQPCGSPARPMVCVPNWQLSKLFSLEMNQARQLMTQTEKQGKKQKIFSVKWVEEWLPCATGGGFACPPSTRTASAARPPINQSAPSHHNTAFIL